MSDDKENGKPAYRELNEDELEQVAGGERAWPDDFETDAAIVTNELRGGHIA